MKTKILETRGAYLFRTDNGDIEVIYLGNRYHRNFFSFGDNGEKKYIVAANDKWLIHEEEITSESPALSVRAGILSRKALMSEDNDYPKAYRSKILQLLKEFEKDLK